MPVEPPPPEVLALLIADQVYRDEISGKLTVLGMSLVIEMVSGTFSLACS